MNCANCGTPLNGTTTCPNCGALNMGFAPDPNQAPNAIETVASTTPPKETIQDNTQANMSADLGIEELNDETPSQVIDESIAPPTLDVNSENLTANEAGVDIANAASTDTYSPEELEHQANMQKEAEERKKQDVNIEIPQNNGPIENIEMPSDGTAPSIDSETPTVGEIKPIEEDVHTTIKFGKKKLKVNLGKRSIPIKLGIGLGILILIIGLMLGSIIFGKKVYTPGGNVINNQPVISKVSDGKNNTTVAGNFSFKVPNKYVYDKKENGLIVYDDADTFRIYIKGTTGKYDDFASAKTSISKTIENQNIAVNNIKELVFNEHNYVLADITSNMTNYLLAFTKSPNEDYIFYIEIVTKDNMGMEDYLTIADDITYNSEFVEKESSMEKVSIIDMLELTKRAAEAYRDTKNNS